MRRFGWSLLYWGVCYGVLSLRSGRVVNLAEFFAYSMEHPLALMIFLTVLFWGRNISAILLRLPQWALVLLLAFITFALAHWYDAPGGMLFIAAVVLLIWRAVVVKRRRYEYAEDLKSFPPPRPGGFSGRSSSTDRLEDEGLL